MTQDATMQLICPPCLAANRVTSNRLADKPVCVKYRAALLPMQPFALTDSTFDHYVDSSDTPVLVDFWAQWCPPCRFMNPILNDLAQRHADIRVVKVDVTTEGQLPLRFKVRAIPSLILFRCGTEIARFSGAMPADQLSAWVDDALQRAPAGHLS